MCSRAIPIQVLGIIEAQEEEEEEGKEVNLDLDKMDEKPSQREGICFVYYFQIKRFMLN